jgi:chromosome segregation ATPase
LKQRREILSRQISQEESQQTQLQSQLGQLQSKLQETQESLGRKLAMRQELNETLEEAESAYTKVFVYKEISLHSAADTRKFPNAIASFEEGNKHASSSIIGQ